jgi:hypothetical protein
MKRFRCIWRVIVAPFQIISAVRSRTLGALLLRPAARHLLELIRSKP